ncbi:MAG: hypothetical protein ACM31L_11220 [Actinomycetota bacterium]
MSEAENAGLDGMVDPSGYMMIGLAHSQLAMLRLLNVYGKLPKEAIEATLAKLVETLGALPTFPAEEKYAEVNKLYSEFMTAIPQTILNGVRQWTPVEEVYKEAARKE